MSIMIGIGISPSLNTGVGGWTPASLGSSLIAWWNADRSDLITLSGSQVTSFRDIISGYDAVQAVSASRPLYSATSFNGAPGLTFDGTDDELSCANATLGTLLPDGAEPGEIWALFDQTRDPADTTQQYVVAYGSTSNLCRRVGRTVVAAQNRVFGITGTGAANVQVSAAGDYSGRHVTRSKVSGTQSSADLDATQGTPAATTPSTDFLRLRFGAAAHTPAAFSKGVLREAILIAGNLSDSNYSNLLNYMNSRRML